MNRLLKIVAAVVMLAAPVASQADLTVFETQDPIAKKTKPPADGGAGWTKRAPGDEITIPAGRSVWFAVLNTEDPTMTKWFRIELKRLEGPGLNSNTPEGFLDGTENGGKSKAVPVHIGTNWNDPGVLHSEYKLIPQPEWERIEFKNSEAQPSKYTIKNCWSVCAQVRPSEFPPLNMATINGSSFGSGTPGAMANSQRITQIWVFPRNAALNINVQPVGQMAPQSGQWQWNFANTDPMGQVRPLGGVVWFTQGRGLVPEEDFLLQLPLNPHLPGIEAFDVFAFDADANVYQHWTMQVDPAWPRPLQ